MRIVHGLCLLMTCAMLLQSCGGARKAEPPARLTLLVSGNTMGYLRNCGCASGQYGGELRRARVLKEQRDEASKSSKGRDSEVLALDLGSTLGGEEFIDRLYSRQVLKSMAQLDYGMIGLGKTDLLFGQADLLDYIQQAEAAGGEGSVPITAVNLHFSKPQVGEDHSRELNERIQKYRILTLPQGYRVGVIHAIDPGVTITLEDGMKVGEKYGFDVMPMAKATQQVLDVHRKEADFWIFTLSDGVEGVADPKPIADIEGLDLVIGFNQGNPNQTPGSDGVVWPFFVKGPILKARDLVEITINFPQSADDDRTVAARQLAVGSKVKGDETVLGLINDIWPEIEKYENEKLASQTVKQRPAVMGQFTCRTCHQNIYESMLLTKHQLAFESLVQRAKEDPEQKNADRDSKCLSCHTTLYISPHGGWNKIDKQEELAMVSCESCHGPGEYHVIYMMETAAGRTLEQIEQIPTDEFAIDGRNDKGIIRGSEDTCKQCHDAENSPKFNFKEYWSRIEHSLDMPAPEQAAEAGTAAVEDAH
ncbi:hypothetical protein KDL44_14195 [bacterium]|nr:hypothetical protein [bacterium]